MAIFLLFKILFIFTAKLDHTFAYTIDEIQLRLLFNLSNDAICYGASTKDFSELGEYLIDYYCKLKNNLPYKLEKLKKNFPIAVFYYFECNKNICYVYENDDEKLPNILYGLFLIKGTDFEKYFIVELKKLKK